MTLLLFSPVILVMILILLLRRPPLHAALGGTALSLLLWLAGVAQPFSWPVLAAISQDTAILFASTACVIAPGLLFVILIERNGANPALSQWLGRLGWQGVVLALMLVLGLAPLLESMTGFGVSLMATVPLLLALLPRPAALRVALAGMSIMPWGTLGLATVIGAALAGLPAVQLGAWTAGSSAAVFVLAAWLTLWQCGQRRLHWYVLAAVLALLFVAMLHLVSARLGPELAGVSAAAVVLMLGALYTRPGLANVMALPAAAWPYLALLLAVLLLKLLNLALPPWLIQGAQVSWQPLASPGLALLLVDLLLLWRLPRQATFAPWLTRAQRPLLTILLFLLMSQLLVKGGFLDGLRLGLQALPLAWLPASLALFGGVAGYITGSNVGGNAIMMPTVAQLDLPAQWLPLLAAVQNSAAGHAALGSLPMVALLCSLAKCEREEEQALIRFALYLVLANVLLVALAGSVLLYWQR